MSTIVVNLFGAPGAGKSTGAAYIFAILKMRGVNAELVTEFAKDKVWEENFEAIGNQPYIFGKQAFRLSRCADKVDVIITDSPLPLSIVYNQNETIARGLNQLVVDTFSSYENMSYFLRRTKPYNPAGRYQDESGSNAIAATIHGVLAQLNISYKEVDGDLSGYSEIIADITKRLGIKADNTIDQFTGKYFFLSNYFNSNFIYKSKLFTNSEAAFHAMKCPERADEFCGLNPPDAKALGRKVKLRPDWEQIKDTIMYEVCYAKFAQNRDLQKKLIETGDAELIEGNFWGDTYWGVCDGEGENHLGKILMRIRDEIKSR